VLIQLLGDYGASLKTTKRASTCFEPARIFWVAIVRQFPRLEAILATHNNPFHDHHATSPQEE